ncbi:MAG: helix-turn-helix domain-containing protein [Lachnospiraceae bacterium]|nr:helix-turn-helix domain-containing protein [Lachnospiraceae bacterium]
MNIKEIGIKISKLREKNGYTQKDLAEKLCISQPTLCRWEKGSITPSLSDIERISEFFHVSVEDIISINPKDYKKVRSLRFHMLAFLSLFLLFVTILFFWIPKYRVIAYSDIHDGFYGKTVTISVKPTFWYTYNGAMSYSSYLEDKYSINDEIDVLEIYFVPSKKDIESEEEAYLITTHMLKEIKND